MADDTEEKKGLRTPRAKCAFVTLLKPKAFEDGLPKYSVVMIFDKAAQATKEFKAMEEAVEEAMSEHWGDKKRPKLRSPFRPSSDKDGFPEDCVFITASTKDAPGVVDHALEPLTSASELYSGIIGRATLTCYSYDKGVNKGVSFGLSNFQKLGDGSPMAAMRPKAKDDFEPVEQEDYEADLDAAFGS